MIAGSANAFIAVAKTLFNFVLWAWLLRVLLQVLRADFYNPFSQFVLRFTRQPTQAISRFLPPWRSFNIAAALVTLLLTLVYIYLMAWVYNQHMTLLLATGLALIKIAVLVLQLYMITLSIQAVLSWFGPGVNNPASNVLWSLNEPFLRPVRRLLPTASGLDLSPLVVILAMLFVSQMLATAMPPYYQ